MQRQTRAPVTLQPTLAKQVRYLRALIDSTRSLIWAVDLSYKVTIFNASLSAFVFNEFNVKMRKGLSPSELFPESQARLWPPLYERALKEGGFRTEYQLPDGRWLEYALNTIVEDGKKVGISVLGRDVTERRRSEGLEAASGSRYRAVIHGAPIGIVVSRNLQVLYVNQKWLEMHGLADDSEVVGHGIDRWLSPAGRELIAERRRLRKSGISIPDEFENTAVTVNGKEFPVQATTADVLLEDGAARLIFIHDISQRKTAEEALLASEARFRSYFELPLVGMAQSSPETGFVAANDRICEMLGYSREELIGRSWLEITHPEDQDANMVLFARMMKGELDSYSIDKRFIRKGGTTVWAVVSAGCIRKPDGTVATVCAILEDITARKAAETELNERLRESRLLSEINVSLLNGRSEAALLAEYCRIIVERGGYKMAWVGVPEHGDGMRVEPVASFGDSSGYLKKVEVCWGENEKGMGPVGRALRSGNVQFSEELSKDPALMFSREAALGAGFHAIIAVPFLQSETDWACLTAYADHPMKWTDAERQLMEQVACALGFGIKSLRTAIAKERYQRDLRASLEETIQVIADTVDQRDPYTAGHQRRVADLCVAIARKIGMDEERIRGLRLAANIHDLGKIGIPAEILAKPGRLTAIQFSLVKEHVQLGYGIVKGVHFPWPIADMILQHHERLDGSGYPSGLPGDALLQESKILMVADVLEAMATHRPYRPARGVESALEEIERGRGSKFDTEVVDACLGLLRHDGYRLLD